MALLARGKVVPEGSLAKRFSCKTPCEIFVGRNALRQALVWCATGRDNTNPHLLFQIHKTDVSFEKACSWNSGDTSIRAREELEGDGVHAKMYEFRDFLIFGSQNNGNSPLFETALVFKKKPKLYAFFEESFKRAVSYQTWWRANKTY